MKIGIDCRKILNPEAGEVGGVAHYNYWLVKNLIKIFPDQQFVLFFDYRMRDLAPFKSENVRVKYFPYSQYKRYLPFTYSHLLAAAFLAREKLDVFHNPTTALPMTYSGKSVVTVHDLAIYHHPEWFPGGFLNRQNFSTKILVPSTLKQAQQIIAVSHFTKNDIINLFKVNPEKITVIPEAVMPEEISVEQIEKARKQLGLTRPYLLFLGTIEPRKNIALLVEVFTKFILKQKKDFALDLVIAGGRGWNNQPVFTAVTQALTQLRDRSATIHMLGTVSHEYKMALIKGAEVFVWPSLFEGFGLPVLEAMTLGTAVITSSTSSIPEVVNGAAMLVEPTNADQIEAAIESLVMYPDRRERLREQGLKRAQDFSWEKSARETLAVYEKAIKS